MEEAQQFGGLRSPVDDNRKALLELGNLQIEMAYETLIGPLAPAWIFMKSHQLAYNAFVTMATSDFSMLLDGFLCWGGRALVEAVTGVNYLTGEELDTTARILAAGSIFIPFFLEPIFDVAGKAIKAGGRIAFGTVAFAQGWRGRMRTRRAAARVARRTKGVCAKRRKTY